jgi:hypothetical protein
VPQQRVIAVEGGLEGLTSKAGSVVGDHSDRCRRLADDLLGGIDDVHYAAIGA